MIMQSHLKPQKRFLVDLTPNNPAGREEANRTDYLLTFTALVENVKIFHFNPWVNVKLIYAKNNIHKKIYIA